MAMCERKGKSFLRYLEMVIIVILSILSQTLLKATVLTANAPYLLSPSL